MVAGDRKVFKQSHTNGFDVVAKRISVVGGGLVGCIAALHLAKKGYSIDLYEFREDIRKCEQAEGRSINLALSARGRLALRSVGLEDQILKNGIPMRGRMIHDLKGNRRIIPYDKNGNECIYSIGRKHLNEALLEASEQYPNIRLHFNHKLTKIHHASFAMEFKNMETNDSVTADADLIIGCDGAYSAVRRQVISTPGFDFSQTFIEHGYLELCIPPTATKQFAMPENYLHIWPRGKFMMIALPNQDLSWTVTLFMPHTNFQEIQTKDDLLQFFNKYFPDSVSLIGEDKLYKDFFKSKAQPLVMIKCRPHHISDKVLLLGDAAHAMVPFYGQGMNAGFEDCTVLNELLDLHKNNLLNTLKEYSANRCDNAHAICDLAMYNYLEMRDLVNRVSYRARKMFDDLLNAILPDLWVPLYNSVSFSPQMSYKECIQNRAWQDRIISRSLWSFSAITTGVLSLLFYRLCTAN